MDTITMVITTLLFVKIFIILLCLHCCFRDGESDSDIYIEASDEYVNIQVIKCVTVEQEENKVEIEKDFEIVDVIVEVHHVEEPKIVHL